MIGVLAIALGLSFLIGIIGAFYRSRILPRIVSLIRIYPLYAYYIRGDTLSYVYDLHNGVYFRLAFDSLSAFLTLLIILVLPFVLSLDESRLIGEAILAESALLGVFLARDAVLMMIFREISLIAVLLMVYRVASARTAMMYLAFAQTGALLALITIFYAFFHVGSASFEALRGFDMPKNYALAAVIGFGIEVPLRPLHVRFIRAIRESNIATATTLMFRNGIFGLFRLLALFPVISERKYLIFRRGTVSAFYAYLSAFGASKIRELVAYLAMGHMSFAFIGLPLRNLATAGALYYMSIHPLILAPLIMLYAVTLRLFGTEDLLEIKEYQHKPIYAFSLAIALLLAASVPVSAGFLGEILVIVGFMSYGIKAIIPAFAPVILISVAVYYIREVLYGPKAEEGVEMSKAEAILVLLIASIAFAIVLRSEPIVGIKGVIPNV